MPRVGFAAFAASARAKAEPAAAPQEADAAPNKDEQPQVPAAVAAAAAAAVSGRARGKNLPVEEVKTLLESLRTASMRPEFQKQLAQLRGQDWGAFKKRQGFAKILAGAWKGAMRAAGFSIDRQGFPQLLATVRGNQPDVRTLSEEVERQLKFPAGALFGAKAGQMKGSATATAAKSSRGAFSSIAGSKEEEQAPAPPVEREPPSVRGRPLGMGEAKEMLKAFKDIAGQKDVQRTLTNMDRQGPEHVAKSMPFLIGQLFNSTMEMFEYPNSGEGYADLVRGIKKHGWNLHVKTSAHEVERLMHMRFGSWFGIPADEGEEEAARALSAAATPKQLEAKAGEFLLVVKHAVENKQIKIVLPESACFADAKEAISKRTGRNDILTRGRLVQKRGGTYSSYRDSDPIGALREVLVLGADLSIEGEEPEEEEEQAPPPVNPYAAQQQPAGREPPPPQRQEPAPPPKPPPDPVPTLTKQQALTLQNELKHGFRGEAFQKRRKEMENSGIKGMKFNAERQKLFMSVQSIVLPRYGFRGDSKGVFDMMKAFETFGGDEDIARNGYDINVLLGLAEPPPPPQPQPPPPQQQPAPAPPPPPPPQPQPPPPKPQPPPPPPQPEKPPEEVQVTVEHALEGGSLTVTIMDDATTLELRKLVMAKLNETKVSQVKIVSRLGDGYQSVPDDRKVKDKRAFLMIGRSIDLPKEPEPPPPAPAAKAKEPEKEIELTVVIDQSLGLKTSLRVKPGTTIAAVKELLAKADASGGTQAQAIGLRLPNSETPLEDGHKLDPGTRELHYSGQASTGEQANISGKWKMIDTSGKESAQFVLLHELQNGTELLKGWQVGAMEIWDGRVLGDKVEWKVGGCLISGKLKDQRWRMAEMTAKTDEGWDMGPFTGEWVCTVEEAIAEQQAAQAGASAEDVEVTVFIDRSLDLKTSMTVKHGSTIWNIKELLASDDPTGKTQPQDFGLRAPDGTELGDGVCITAARELEIMMQA